MTKIDSDHAKNILADLTNKNLRAAVLGQNKRGLFKLFKKSSLIEPEIPSQPAITPKNKT